MKKAIIAIIILAVIGGGVFALTRGDSKPTTTSNTPVSSTPSSSPSPTAKTTDNNAAATITYTNSGFNPSTLTVKAGTTVTIKNDSSNELVFDSDPHPVHTDDPELNIGAIDPGQSKTFTPTVTGTHGYHNHQNSSDTGTLVVQ